MTETERHLVRPGGLPNDHGAAVGGGISATAPVPLLILVGADKGGVGKTMLARVMCDLLSKQQVAIWDSEVPRGGLRRFYPDAQLVDATTTPGQMRIFDGMSSAPVTLVDVRAALLSPTLRAMGYAGLISDVAQRGARLAVVHVLGPTRASLDEIADTAGLLADGGELCSHYLVKNHLTEGQFFEWDRETQEAYFTRLAPTAVLDIPHLDDHAAEVMEKAACPFAEFLRPGAQSHTLQGKVRRWLADAQGELCLKVRELAP